MRLVSHTNAGFGASGGANFAINDDGTIGGIGGATPLKVSPGAGFGAGKSTSSTFVVPSLNDILGHK
jgi:filamentous hemagglutinin